MVLRVVALCLIPASALAADFRLFPNSVPASHFFSEPQAAVGFRLFQPSQNPPWRDPARRSFGINLTIPAHSAGPPEADPLVRVTPRRSPPRLFTTGTVLVSGGVFVASSLYAMASPWDWGFESYHFHNEGFFGRNTYAGGADKSSHFVISASLARELALLYDRQGHTETQSTALAFGLTFIAGAIVESGDAISPYGFSWEDLTADTLGAAAGLWLLRRGLNDLIGLRAGKVPTNLPVPEGHTPHFGANYSNEIYSADLKIAGLARRLRFDAGPARFLLASVTYGTKGYGYAPPLPVQERLLGFEVGLNMPEILNAVGVTETSWWGSLLHKALNFFRIPYTSFGFRYDLNHGRWHGPDTGNVLY